MKNYLNQEFTVKEVDSDEYEITVHNTRNWFCKLFRIGYDSYTCVGTFGKWYRKRDDRPIYGLLKDDLNAMLRQYVDNKLGTPMEYKV